MIAPVAIDEPICPWGGITFEGNERHVRRNALANPTTEFWGLKVLECFLWWSESSEIGRRVTARGIMYVVPFDQASLRGSNA